MTWCVSSKHGLIRIFVSDAIEIFSCDKESDADITVNALLNNIRINHTQTWNGKGVPEALCPGVPETKKKEKKRM